MVCYLLNLLKSIHPNLQNEENHFSIGVNSSLQPFKFFFKLVERCRGKMQYQILSASDWCYFPLKINKKIRISENENYRQNRCHTTRNQQAKRRPCWVSTRAKGEWARLPELTRWIINWYWTQTLIKIFINLYNNM